MRTSLFNSGWKLRMLMKKADSLSNIFLFFIVFVVAIILIVWYLQTVNPSRVVVSQTLHDSSELVQHFRNACAATTYNATYLLKTPLTTNTTHYCLVQDGVFGTCRESPCPLLDSELEAGLVRLEKSGDSPITLQQS